LTKAVGTALPSFFTSPISICEAVLLGQPCEHGGLVAGDLGRLAVQFAPGETVPFGDGILAAVQRLADLSGVAQILVLLPPLEVIPLEDDVALGGDSSLERGVVAPQFVVLAVELLGHPDRVVLVLGQ
jgi:hypothetical protein